MTPRVFTVQSSSRPGVSYKVMVYPDKTVCTCPHYQLRHAECKHIKAIRRKYGNKQTTQSRPIQHGNGIPQVRSNHQGHEDWRDPVPSGELLGSNSEHGNEARDNGRTEPDGSRGHSSNGQNAKTSVGTPNAGADVPRSTERGDTTTPKNDQGVRNENNPRQCANRIGNVQCTGTAKGISTWCDDCRFKYLPDPKRKHTSFEEGMKRLEKLKKAAKHPTDYDAGVEIFGNIPPAPRVKDDRLDF